METNEQRRFFEELLGKYPRLAEFWDREKREFLDEKAEKALQRILSSGESLVLRALASIWMGDGNSYRIDFTDLAALSDEWKKPLVQWIITPFWP